jgi:hypothetical protein
LLGHVGTIDDRFLAPLDAMNKCVTVFESTWNEIFFWFKNKNVTTCNLLLLYFADWQATFFY